MPECASLSREGRDDAELKNRAVIVARLLGMLGLFVLAVPMVSSQVNDGAIVLPIHSADGQTTVTCRLVPVRGGVMEFLATCTCEGANCCNSFCTADNGCCDYAKDQGESYVGGEATIVTETGGHPAILGEQESAYVRSACPDASQVCYRDTIEGCATQNPRCPGSLPDYGRLDSPANGRWLHDLMDVDMSDGGHRRQLRDGGLEGGALSRLRGVLDALVDGFWDEREDGRRQMQVLQSNSTTATHTQRQKGQMQQRRRAQANGGQGAAREANSVAATVRVGFRQIHPQLMIEG